VPSNEVTTNSGCTCIRWSMIAIVSNQTIAGSVSMQSIIILSITMTKTSIVSQVCSIPQSVLPL